MKRVFEIIGIISVSMALNAAAVDGGGFLRIVDAAAHGDGPLRVAVDGQPISVRGYQLGDVSGCIPLERGKHTVTFDREGVQAGRSVLVIGSGRFTTLVIHDRLQQSGGKQRWCLRGLRVDGEDRGGGEARRMLRVISVSATAMREVAVKPAGDHWQKHPLASMRSLDLPIRQSRGYMSVCVGEHRQISVPVTTSGWHVVVLYDDLEGRPAGVLFLDRRAWLAE